MNLFDLIKEKYPDGKLPELTDTSMTIPELTGKSLEQLKEEILECEEFKYCDEIIFLDYPIVKDGNNESISLPIFKLIPGQYFKGKCYLYCMFLSPPMFIGKDLVKLVKDDAAISPVTYSEDFKPSRRIVLLYSPETNQIRNKLHETLDKILDNPADYQIEGERSVVVRGLFDIIVDNDGWERNLKLVHPITTDK